MKGRTGRIVTCHDIHNPALSHTILHFMVLCRPYNPACVRVLNQCNVLRGGEIESERNLQCLQEEGFQRPGGQQRINP